MFATIKRGWALTKMSLGVIKKDKELLLFPVMAGIGLILAMVGFLALGGYMHLGLGLATDQVAILAIPYYFVAYFITIYFNTGLVSAARIRLDGGDPNVGDGIRGANKRIRAILGWTLIAATVGIILQILQSMARDRRNIIGQILAGLVSFAWSALTYFVIPVIAAEGLGPIQAIKRSGAVLKRTWGETVVGHVGIGLIFFLLGLLGLIPLFLAAQTGIVEVIVPVAILVFLYWIVLSVVSSAASQVLVATLYRFATVGDTGGVMPPQTANAVFNPNADWSAHTDPNTGRVRGA